MSAGVKIVLVLLGLFLLANLLYLVKSLVGVNLFPGHYGAFFPLGDWIYRALTAKHA